MAGIRCLKPPQVACITRGDGLAPQDGAAPGLFLRPLSSSSIVTWQRSAYLNHPSLEAVERVPLIVCRPTAQLTSQKLDPAALGGQCDRA